MKAVHEQVELIRAAIVLAVADGHLSACEKGLLTAMAYRVGIGQASLDAMIERARREPASRTELFRHVIAEPDVAMELLVAAARLDGEISVEEREVLVQIMERLQIPQDRFAEIYHKAIARADALRKARSGATPTRPADGAGASQ